MTRDEIDQRRADFVTGYMARIYETSQNPQTDTGRAYAREHAHEQAAKELPYPTQPRVVTIYNTDFRVINGRLEHRTREGWTDWLGWDASAIRRIADLLDHPNEDTP